MKPVRTATIRNKRYKICWSLSPSLQAKLKQLAPDNKLPIMGVCELPSLKGKRLAFDLRHADTELEAFGVVLHECLHAAFWDLDEDSIDEAATDISRFLYRIGVRLTKPLPGVKCLNQKSLIKP